MQDCDVSWVTKATAASSIGRQFFAASSTKRPVTSIWHVIFDCWFLHALQCAYSPCHRNQRRREPHSFEFPNDVSQRLYLNGIAKLRNYLLSIGSLRQSEVLLDSLFHSPTHLLPNYTSAKATPRVNRALTMTLSAALRCLKCRQRAQTHCDKTKGGPCLEWKVRWVCLCAFKSIPGR